ncbi:MAG: Tetratricopeptide repeat-containing protein [Firmicutes bacterium]|nr:Tetratricopeptide repeat-containing protein [Bacillota bacterium]
MKRRWYISAFVVLLYSFMIPGAVGFAIENPPVVNHNQVIADCTTAIADNPYDTVSYYKRGKAYFAQKQYDLALKDYNRVIATAYLDRGYLYEKMGEPDKAIEHYSLSILNDPNYEVAYDHRGFMYNKIGRYDLALIDCSKAIEINPKFPAGYLNKGTAYEKQHLYKEAIETYRSMLENVPLEDTHHRDTAIKRIKALEKTI